MWGARYDYETYLRREAEARKEARQRAWRRSRQRSCSFHLKRVPTEIVVLSETGAAVERVPAQVILNDLQPQGILLFTARPVAIDQWVTLTLDHPRRLVMSGKVTRCHTYEVSPRILSAQSYPYRIRVDFVFQTSEDREGIRQVCEELQGELVRPVAA